MSRGTVLSALRPSLDLDRFDAFMATLVRERGLNAVGGKGGVGDKVMVTMREIGCVYLAMPGGAAPLLSKGAVECLVLGNFSAGRGGGPVSDLEQATRLQFFSTDNPDLEFTAPPSSESLARPRYPKSIGTACASSFGSSNRGCVTCLSRTRTCSNAWLTNWSTDVSM
ncbi:fumarate hydratase C-terminal domain-containing protein [Pseudooceanicola sp. HF7]|uniref:fumarate hydratase C-terminal domain-containing protein n=1 Tax=Pseudooceanicola sp. HF7 TaxID=2721560 RepID=UPI001431252D|nr:hypothetical protein [Pseudooceanicola sp. HF7]